MYRWQLKSGAHKGREVVGRKDEPDGVFTLRAGRSSCKADRRSQQLEDGVDVSRKPVARRPLQRHRPVHVDTIISCPNISKTFSRGRRHRTLDIVEELLAVNLRARGSVEQTLHTYRTVDPGLFNNPCIRCSRARV